MVLSDGGRVMTISVCQKWLLWEQASETKGCFFFIMRLSVLIAFFLTLYIAVITLSVSGYVIYGLGHCSLLSLGNITAAKFAIIKSEAR